MSSAELLPNLSAHRSCRFWLAAIVLSTHGSLTATADAHLQQTDLLGMTVSRQVTVAAVGSASKTVADDLQAASTWAAM